MPIPFDLLTKFFAFEFCTTAEDEEDSDTIPSDDLPEDPDYPSDYPI